MYVNKFESLPTCEQTMVIHGHSFLRMKHPINHQTNPHTDHRIDHLIHHHYHHTDHKHTKSQSVPSMSRSKSTGPYVFQLLLRGTSPTTNDELAYQPISSIN